MRNSALPAGSGVGFKPEHFSAIIEERQPLAFFEVHAENYMGEGGLPHAHLNRIRQDYGLSIHGVGLSIGSMQGIDPQHLARVKRLVDRYQPHSFSEHLAWSTHDSVFLNDLLPLPYTAETLARICDHIDDVQETLQQQMLLENPSTYLQFEESTIAETDFIAEIVRRTGCGLLLDVNNVFVSATNHGYEPLTYLDAFPLQHVREIHLAGHAATTDDSGAPLLIDSHDAPVIDPVWQLFASVIARTGPVPTLIERDGNVPAWMELRAEAMLAQRILAMSHDQAA